MIKVFTSGNLVADPELVAVGSGNCCQFKIAANMSIKGTDGRPKVLFPRVTIWGKRGEVAAQYLKKGSKVIVSGDLIVDEYVGRDGANHINSEIRNADFDFASSDGSASSGQTADDEDEDLFS